jgi:cation transport ATPase
VHIFVDTVDRADKYARIERWTAYGAVVLAVLAGLFLAILTFVAHQACYGMSNAHPVCHTVTGGNLLGTVQTTLVILATVLALYVGAAFAARWQTRTRHKDARSTAYMALVTCAVTILAFTLPAAGGSGFFFLPAMLLLLASAGAGLPAMLQANRDPARNDPEDEEQKN